jgi:hypothetical protein
MKKSTNLIIENNKQKIASLRRQNPANVAVITNIGFGGWTRNINTIWYSLFAKTPTKAK